MTHSDKSITGCNNGAKMWHDNVLKYGFDEAVTICRNYLDMNLRREHSEDEHQFCRELFSEMYYATVGKVDPRKLVYPYDFKTANERTEASYYHASRELNTACARGIDRIINASCYKPNYYNLEMAAICAVVEFGLLRVCSVLAFNYQFKGSDGRFSILNRQWANTFAVNEKAFCGTWLQSHATLVNSFCGYIRELYQRLDAEQQSLPGEEVHNEFVSGVEIKRSIVTSDDGNGFKTGYAIGHNPEAVTPWVCWQFAIRNGEKHYNWGVYADDKQTAIDAYNARVFVALYREENK